MRCLLTAAALLTGKQALPDPWLLIEDGQVHSFGSQSAGLPDHEERHDLGSALIAPAMLDIHVHGAAGHDVMEGAESVTAVACYLATRGVGAFLPTTVTAPVDDTLRALDVIASSIEQAAGQPLAADGAIPLGIHLEGPFLSHAKRGVHPPSLLQPASVELFKRFWQAARGTIRLLTIAPELPGALELIQHATARGVRVSVGHSDATAAETRAGIAAGARSATHTFNAMRGLDHREPGMLGVVLDDQDLYAELICDGIHVDPTAVRLFARLKGAERAILITDGMSATGMPEGRYKLGGFDVDVANGRAMRDGVLAGSILTMDRAVANYARFTGLSIADVMPLATRNPAALTGLAEHVVIAPGHRADLVALSPVGQLVATCIAGRFERRA